MSRRHIKHIAQSVEGALRNWKDRDWKRCADENNCTVNEVKDAFWSYLSEGKKLIPIGHECEGFSYQTGCPGHEVENENTTPET